MNEVTRVINAIERGDEHAADELLPLVYNELRRLASRRLSQEQPGQTLQTTALVHEAYIRLVGANSQDWNSRGHFFGAAAEAMRRILVEKARRKASLKCGGDRKRVEMDDADAVIEAPSEDLLALDEALTKLAQQEPSITEVVKLRYFAGLTLDEAAKILGISSATAARYWAYGRTWLLKEMTKYCE